MKYCKIKINKFGNIKVGWQQLNNKMLYRQKIMKNN